MAVRLGGLEVILIVLSGIYFTKNIDKIVLHFSIIMENKLTLVSKKNICMFQNEIMEQACYIYKSHKPKYPSYTSKGLIVEHLQAWWEL